MDKKKLSNISYRNDAPELFDDAIDLVTAIPPATSTVNSTVFISAINGTVVTLDFGNNSVNPTTGQFGGTTTYKDVLETQAIATRQVLNIDADITILVANGNVITMNHTANSNVTLTPVDAAKPTSVEIIRSVTTGNPTLTFVNAIYPSGIPPTLTTGAATDKIHCLYLPAPIGKWLITGTPNYNLTPATTFDEGRGGSVVGFNPALDERKLTYLGDLPENYSFPMQINVPDTMALAVGQECVVGVGGGLYATSVIYDKPTNSYTSRVELADTSVATSYEMQTITQAGADLVITYAAGNIPYFVQNANIASLSITGLPGAGARTGFVIIRKKDSTANAYTITLDTAKYFGEVIDSPVWTDAPDAIDMLIVQSGDGGLTYRTRIINDFR